jgi:hypothetical protein
MFSTIGTYVTGPRPISLHQAELDDYRFPLPQLWDTDFPQYKHAVRRHSSGLIPLQYAIAFTSPAPEIA